MFYSTSDDELEEQRLKKEKQQLAEQEKENLFRDPLEANANSTASKKKSHHHHKSSHHHKSKSRKHQASEEDGQPSSPPPPELPPPRAEEASPKPSTRPQSSNARAMAAKRALAQEEKRKARREGATSGMVVPSEITQKPAKTHPDDSANDDNNKEEGSSSPKPQNKEVKDLIKVRESKDKKITSAEKELLERGITSSFDPNTEEDVKEPPKPQIDLSDIHSFLMRPAPKGMLLECRIEREKTRDRHPMFYLYLEQGNRFLLAARKRKKSKTSNYLISLDKADLSRNSGHYVGKVRSNFMGTEFVFYDKGEAPKPDSTSDLVGIRHELGAVVFSSNVLGLRGPRKMKAIIPGYKPDESKIVFKPLKQSDSILDKYKSQTDLNDMIILQNKAPVWNEETKSFTLNFRNRVKQASVKNFQIVSESNPDTIVMQFGRVSSGTFSMDYQYPLTLFQAFAIALTSFDNKLSVD